MTLMKKMINDAYDALPQKWKDHPEIKMICVEMNPFIFAAACPEFAPMLYREADKKWEEIKYQDRIEHEDIRHL